MPRPRKDGTVADISVGEDGMTKLQRAFVEEYIMTGGRTTEAALRAGYSKGSAPRRGYENLRLKVVQDAILTRQKEKMASSGVMAMHVIEYLALEGKTHGIRLAAAKDLADRTGWKPKEQIEVTTTMSPEDRRARIAELEIRLGYRQAKVIDVVEAGEEATKQLDSTPALDMHFFPVAEAGVVDEEREEEAISVIDDDTKNTNVDANIANVDANDDRSPSLTDSIDINSALAKRLAKSTDRPGILKPLNQWTKPIDD